MLAEGRSMNEGAAQGVRYTMVRGPVMCERICVRYALCVGVAMGVDVGATCAGRRDLSR